MVLDSPNVLPRLITSALVAVAPFAASSVFLDDGGADISERGFTDYGARWILWGIDHAFSLEIWQMSSVVA